MQCTPRGFVALTFLVLAPYSLWAQSISGTILGSVQDTTGAAVPGASVTIVNSETDLTRTVTTNSTGEYDVPSLPPGTYNISVEMKGFKKVSLSGVRLNVDQKARVDLKLEVGDLAESVQVQALVPTQEQIKIVLELFVGRWGQRGKPCPRELSLDLFHYRRSADDAQERAASRNAVNSLREAALLS